MLTPLCSIYHRRTGDFLIRGMDLRVLDERRKRDHNLREHVWSGIGKKELTP